MRLPELSKPNMRSVRFRATAGAVLALLTLLTIAGLTINWFVGRAVQQSLDTTLLEQAGDRAALIGEGAPIESLITPVGDEEIVAAIATDGTVIASSGAAVGSTELDLRPGISTIEIEIFEPGEGLEQERLRAAVVEATNGIRVVVANEGYAAKETQAAVRTTLFTVVPLTALAGMTVAWFVIGRALRPVRKMSGELDDVVAAGDGRRVSEPGTGDEVDELGSTINGVLDRLDAQSLAQRRFVADASHELKSPLANARAVIDTAAVDDTDAEFTRVTSAVSTELHRLHGLVDDLLYLARGDEGPPRSPQPTDLADLIFDECERVAATSSKRIDASRVAPLDAVVDQAEAARALRNLIENAERFATSTVSVAVEARDRFAVVTVADDGPGIAAEDRESIFERFTRIDSDRTRAAGGTGLGLSIVASIAERHGGTVEVSTAPGGGAHFELSFPLS